MARTFIAAILLATLAGSASSFVSAQGRAGGDLRALQTRLQQRFEMLPIANGVVLKPRFATSIRAIDVTNTAIAVDGSPLTGGELRQKLGADADLIFQLSYLDDASRRTLLGLAAEPAAGDTGMVAAATVPEIPRPRTRDALVRIGGSVTIAEDEHVTDDVVVIGGSADVDGQVDGQVVVIGGTLTLGPHANVLGDLAVIGGTLSKDPKAILKGKVAEIGVGGLPFGGGALRRGYGWRPDAGLSPIVRFGGTIVRVALLMLLAGVVLLVARTPVEQIAARAAAQPVKSWLVGFLAEILFVPMLILTGVVLLISIIGIPLLLLVPLVIVAAVVVSLVGFTGIAYHVGGLLQDRVDPLRTRPYLATLCGIALIVSPVLLARVVGLTGQLGFLVTLLVAIGLMAEYLAWTAGLGAVALLRFEKRRPVAPAPAAEPPAMALP